MTLYIAISVASRLTNQAAKNALLGFRRFMNKTNKAGATHAAGAKSHFGESKIKQTKAAMANEVVWIVFLLIIFFRAKLIAKQGSIDRKQEVELNLSEIYPKGIRQISSFCIRWV